MLAGSGIEFCPVADIRIPDFPGRCGGEGIGLGDLFEVEESGAVQGDDGQAGIRWPFIAGDRLVVILVPIHAVFVPGQGLMGQRPPAIVITRTIQV